MHLILTAWPIRCALIAVAIVLIASVCAYVATGVVPDSPQTVAQTPTFTIHEAAPSEIRYVAVGDSYSAGTGTSPEQAWPVLLTEHLRSRGVKIALVANLGVDGWTTEDALAKEMPAFEKAAPQFATLMIGVNDTYRPTSADAFRAKFVALANRMQKALPDPGRLIAMTIPDFSVTPVGDRFADQNDARRKLVTFNAIIKDEASKRGIPVVDVYTLSQRMASDHSLISGDGLHPSANEYDVWARRIEPVAYRLLKNHAT